ncbi:MAG: SPOR domain-containing protein [Acidobacteriaceae bacterium]
MAALCEEDLDVHDPVEVHWSTSTILAIFFAASLISAVFFGLGYSFGGAGTSKHSVAINSAPTSSNSTGSAVLQTPSHQAAELSRPAAVANTAGNVGTHAAESAPSKMPVPVHPATAPPVAHPSIPVAEKHLPLAAPVVRESATANGASETHIMVQVGAIGDRRDAERLVAELRKKGFHAGIYLEKRDKFLHVQIGPFKDAQQAQFERHQVMASGFHAILKSAS